MITIVRWTGREVRLLRHVLRMSVRDFAAHADLSASSIADMEAKGERTRLRHTTQKILDEVLSTAPSEAKQRFCAVAGSSVLQPTREVVNSDARISLVPSPHAAANVEERGDLDSLIFASDATATGGTRHDLIDDAPIREFAMAARDTARFLRQAGVTVSSELVDQLRSDVDGLAVEYLRQPPYAVFASISVLRREVFSLLDRHVPAQYLSDLYVCAGNLTALLAHASADLGQPAIAGAHAQSAWLCGELAGHDPLRAYVRWVQANIAHWAGQHRQAAEIAADGRRHATVGSSMLRLASQEARAWAASGDQRAVEQALAAVQDERDRHLDHADEVGAFRFSAGKAAYYAAETWLAAGGVSSARRARDDADDAYTLLAAESQPSPELVGAAQLDLATAHLALGELEEAAATMSDVLALPAERRTVPVTRRAVQVGAAVSAREIATSPVAADLAEQIRLFTAYPATQELATEDES